MKKILSKIKYILIATQFAITILFLILFMYIFRSKNRALRKAWTKMQTKIMGIEVQIKGTVSEDANMYLINHQSLLDIVVLESLHTKDLCWVAKKQIGDLPIFGHILKAPKMIAIDRDSKKSLIKLIKDVKEMVKKDRPVCIFPEGTRGRGDKLLKFKSGSKMVANKLGLKVQPIVLTNTRDILDSKGFTASSGVVTVNYLDVVDMSDENWFENMKENMQKVLDSELANITSDR
jgi:1-acyl-sn-glycerol-3-phosphate acyltransferase